MMLCVDGWTHDPAMIYATRPRRLVRLLADHLAEEFASNDRGYLMDDALAMLDEQPTGRLRPR